MFNASLLNNNSYTSHIDRTINELTKNVFLHIKTANNNQINKITYELPYYIESLLEIVEKDIMTIENLRTLIWGRIIECLNQNGFETSVSIHEIEEKCHLFISWPTSLDKHTRHINKYHNLIKNCKFNF